MKIKQMVCYQIDIVWRSIRIFYSILLGVYLLNTLFMLMVKERVISFGNPEFMSMIYLFVMGICLFKEPLYMGLANGVSRRSAFFSFSISTFIFSAVVMVVNRVLNLVFQSSISFDFYDMVYGESTIYGTLAENPAIGVFAQMLLSFVMSFAMLFLGYFIGGAYYRMGKATKGIVSSCVPIFFFLLLPLIITALPKNIQDVLFDGFNAVIHFISAAPWNMVLLITGGGLFCALFSWLLIRRAPLKA